MSILREDQHEIYFEALLASMFGTVSEARRQPPLRGVYAFFEVDNAVYVGRTSKRGLGPRMQNHLTLNPSQGVLAFKLARRHLGLETAYSGDKTRLGLMKDATFVSVFRERLAYVAGLSVRFAEIEDSDDQYVFEYYASKRLKSPNNDFNTH
jgi:hypothetical protein